MPVQWPTTPISGKDQAVPNDVLAFASCGCLVGVMTDDVALLGKREYKAFYTEHAGCEIRKVTHKDYCDLTKDGWPNCAAHPRRI